MEIISIYKLFENCFVQVLEIMLCFLSIKSITLFIAASGAASNGLFCLGSYNAQSNWD